VKVASSKGYILSPQAEKLLKRQVITDVKEAKQLSKAEVIQRNTLKRNYKSLMQEFKKLNNLKEPLITSEVEVKSITKIESEQSQSMVEPKEIDFNNLFKIEQSELELPESPRFVIEHTEEQSKDTQQSFIFPESTIIYDIKYVPIEEYNNKLDTIRDQLDKINKEVESINKSITVKLSRL